MGKNSIHYSLRSLGVTCDRSGMRPIVGTRYHLPGQDYDLCQAEWDKLPPEEQATGLQISGSKFQSSNSNSRELELTK